MLANGSLIHNPNAWSEKYNVLALDHVRCATFCLDIMEDAHGLIVCYSP